MPEIPGPIDVDFGRITWSGTYGATEEEIFAYGRWAYWPVGTDLTGVLDTIEGDVTNLLAQATTGSTPFTALSQIFPSDVHWLQVKAQRYTPGTNTLVGESEARGLSDVGLGAEGNGLPYQMTLAITTEAAFPDRKRRSRFYLPRFVHNALDGHGRVLSTIVDDLQTQLDFQQTANTTASPPVFYCINAPSAGKAYEIDRYHSGNIIDTQRRRRNKLPEVRHTQVV